VRPYFPVTVAGPRAGRQDSTRWCVLARCLFPILPHTRAPGGGRLFGFDHPGRGLSVERCLRSGSVATIYHNGRR